jgi:hypothetical protein
MMPAPSASWHQYKLYETFERLQTTAQYLAQTYGEETLLAILPLGMVEVAQTWFDSLSNHTRRLMNKSLNEWTEELLSRFQANASSAIMEADAMKYYRLIDTAMNPLPQSLPEPNGTHIGEHTCT